MVCTHSVYFLRPVNSRDANGYTGLDLSTFCGNTQVAAFLDKLSLQSIHFEMKKIVNSPNFADMKILIKDQTVYAHKAILVVRLAEWESLIEKIEAFSLFLTFSYIIRITM
jgi:hypothetical protein